MRWIDFHVKNKIWLISVCVLMRKYTQEKNKLLLIPTTFDWEKGGVSGQIYIYIYIYITVYNRNEYYLLSKLIIFIYKVRIPSLVLLICNIKPFVHINWLYINIFYCFHQVYKSLGHYCSICAVVKREILPLIYNIGRFPGFIPFRWRSNNSLTRS